MKGYFSSDFLERLARKHKFVQRKSTLTAQQFVDLLMFASKSPNQLSLEDLVNDYSVQHGLDISKQALHQRFNDFSVTFLAELLEEQLSKHLLPVKKSEDYKQFNRIRVKDSTRFSVPSEYAQTYKGQGGIGTVAQISIQYEYDLLYGKPIVLSLTSACRNDQQDSKETLANIEKGDLLIRDLAYTSQGYIQHIEKAEAYYLNRLNSKWKIFDQNGVEIDLSKIHKRLKRYSIPLMEIDAFIKIGKEDIQTRLIVSKVNNQTYNKRLHKAQIAAGSKGYKLTDKFKTCAALNLFITNIPKQWMKAAQVRATYSLRWQIELTFKVWKSQANISKIKSMKLQRFQCQLLAKFLWILLHWKMLWLIQEWIVNYTKNQYYKCSIWKFYKVAFLLSGLLRQVLHNVKSPVDWIAKLIANAERKYLTELKNKKLNTQKILYSLA
ncbi:IS4 family transposase [Chryseosolibacter indicus]|uniref:IS4 family transposase n=1 Tax=Chryseosolibacter indicus TaxID=2782351 RepID=UPI0020B25BE5